MDRLSVMRAYCRIVELNSFKKASEDVGVSSALLSREIKLLEQSLGCQLLSRTTRSMSLTEYGQIYCDETKRLLDEIDDLNGSIREKTGIVQGHLKINAPVSFGLEVLSPMLPDFLSSYPDLQVSLTLDDHVLDMIEGGFDISIRVKKELPSSALVAKPICVVKQQMFASPSYLNTHGKPKQVEDLELHTILTFSLADHSSKWGLTGPDGHVSVPIHAKVVVNNSLILRDLLISGQGIGTLPSFISEPAVNDGLLERVLPDHELSDRHVFAVMPTRLSTDAKIRAFIDHLKRFTRDSV